MIIYPKIKFKKHIRRLFLTLIIFAALQLVSYLSPARACALNGSSILNTEAGTDNSFLSQIRLFGTFAASYTYNFANPSANSQFPYGNYNGNYIDDYKANGFTLNELDLTVSKNAFSNGRNTFGIGFKVSLDTGENIQAVGPYTGNFSYYTEPVYGRKLYGFRQFNISFGIPVGNGLKIYLGEKNYLIGFESYNLSRAWTNTYSLITAIEPGELTGIFLRYPFTKQLKMVLGAALTDNATVPLDRYPTFEYIASYKPFKFLKFHEGIVYGAENFIIYNNNLYQDNLDRFFYNFIDAKYSFCKYWTAVL
ncbi:MAG: outer membrane beta-barrel protein, partial [bacterium]